MSSWRYLSHWWQAYVVNVGTYRWSVTYVLYQHIMSSRSSNSSGYPEEIEFRSKIKRPRSQLLLCSDLQKPDRLTIYSQTRMLFYDANWVFNGRIPCKLHSSSTPYDPMVLPANQEVAATCVSFLFFGFYLTTLFHCLRWLVFADEGWKIRNKISWTMLTITLTICILGTITRALEINNAMKLAVSNKIPSGPPILRPSSTGESTTLSWMAVVIVSLLPPRLLYILTLFKWFSSVQIPT